MNPFLTLFIFFVPIFFLLTRRRNSPSQRLPPGSLGLPIIGQSLVFLRELKANTAEKWLEERARKYGPISKLSLFGKPTVFIHGQAANKFVFSSDSSVIANQQPDSFRTIMGERNVLELSGEDHKRVRNALMSFLKPECLKQYVGKMDGEVRRHLELHWEGQQKVTVMPLMKTLAFDMICSLLCGIERGSRRDEMTECVKVLIDGLWTIPLNFPFTRYYHGLRASERLQNILKEIVDEKRLELEQQGVSSHQDLITCLVSICGKDDGDLISEEEIVHNAVAVMFAGHETSATLITFIIRVLANEPAIYARVVQEQEEIAKGKAPGELLTWEDIAKMKYTWKVALETLRMVPPVFGGFRKTLKDIEYGGFIIPKGWQIFWGTCMTHMDGGIFEEPSKFDPTRFENQASLPPYCFIPVGGGPRICPGYEFAKIETLVAIHNLYDMAKQMYYEDTGKYFSGMDGCWAILEHAIKWQDITPSGRKAKTPEPPQIPEGMSFPFSPEASQIPSTYYESLDAETTPSSGGTGSVSSPRKRPGGKKLAKEKKAKSKVQEVENARHINLLETLNKTVSTTNLGGFNWKKGELHL
ncbi:hypothetical protein Vadar_019099 [Vaccinium darrowii]|uniref:Uncharacterized protein n=1 Tax=Vaccinium darrowii TaxID=229202 RepID=A0ACB7XRN0_9ERIC|nr:hypothetical protein Vadar_019099 [Vaccinium darrowii]